jgi:soluble lytic murein transglycosylase
MRQAFLGSLKRSSPILLSVSLGGLVVVGAWVGISKLQPQPEPPQIVTVEPDSRSRTVMLSFQSAAERRPVLETLARQGSPTEQNQARYLLAADALRQKNGASALQWLNGLETRYPLLAPKILSLQAQAYTLEKKDSKAAAAWKQMIAQYPKDAAAADAYDALGQTNPRYYDQLIATLPAHPRAVAIAITRLKQSPKDKALLLLVAQHGQHLENYRTYLDRLVQLGPQLTPQEWQKVGFGYWEKLQYKEAGLAYSRAPSTSRNAYRAARGLQLGGENSAAIAAYKRMIAALPQAPETPKALIRLADMTDDSAMAIAYLDQSLQLSAQLKRPEDSADALARKARRFKKTNPAQQAAIETQLLKQFSQTTAAADLRWTNAWEAAKAQQIGTARQWAQQVVQANPDSEQAPKALFWSGKWAERLSNPTARQQDFNRLWQRYPESYYAWRVAALSGSPVGDFQSIRTQTPSLNPPTQRLPLTVGSASLRELYLLGEDQTAWEQWQVEFEKSRETPSIPEQLTDGLVRLQVGEYLDGLFMLGNLRDRVVTEPESQPQRAAILALRQDPRYWQALYPIPYWTDIQRWSKAQSLNPVLVLGLMRQESRFTLDIKSVVGATGLMQLMPDTAKEVASALKLKTYRLDQSSDNIQLGTWYLNSTHETFQGNSMLAIASYNAGPGNVDEWLKTLNIQDSDIFVETIPFDETQTYVKTVLENYWNYLRLYNPQIQTLISARS